MSRARKRRRPTAHVEHELEVPVAERAAHGIESVALVIILAVLVGRCFMGEPSYRADTVIAGNPSLADYRPDETLIRTDIAMTLLIAAAIWAVAQIVRGSWRLRAPLMWVGLALLAGLGFVSAWRAIDARSGLTGWIEQVSLVVSALVMIHLVAADRRRWTMLLAVLVAIGAVAGLQAISYVTLEHPAAVKEFESDPAAALAQRGLRPETTAARRFEARLRDPAAVGYVGMSNVLASLLLVLGGAAVGLLIERIPLARADLRDDPPETGPAGGGLNRDVPLMVIAAALTGLMAALTLAALPLTRSKGGLAGAIVAVAVGLALAKWRKALVRRRRRILIGVAATILIIIVAAGLYGASAGTLPGGESIRIRWEYWAGSAGAIKDSPGFGTGPGNFVHGYLPHRLPESPESPKTAHNILVDAMVAFGLPGGAVYLALLAMVLIAMTRPAATEDPTHPPMAPEWRLLLAIALAAAALAGRLIWVGATGPEAPPSPGDPGNPGLVFFLMAVAIPSECLMVALLAAMWGLGRLDPRSAAGRIAAGAGLAGFVAHNMLTYSLLRPATATVFWVVAGAAVGLTAAKGRKLDRRFAAVLAAGMLAASIAVGVWMLRPVARRARHVAAAEAAYVRGERARCVDELLRASDADPLDAYPSANIARICMQGPSAEIPQPLESASITANEAWVRMPAVRHATLYSNVLWARAEPSEWLLHWGGLSGDLAKTCKYFEKRLERYPESRPAISCLAEAYMLMGRHAEAYRLLAEAASGERAESHPKLFDHLGDAAWLAGKADEARAAWARYIRLSTSSANVELRDRSIDLARRAVDMDPNSITLRIDCARKLFAAGRPKEALQHVEQALKVDRARPAESNMRLSPKELVPLELLKAKILAARRPVATQPAGRLATR